MQFHDYVLPAVLPIFLNAYAATRQAQTERQDLKSHKRLMFHVSSALALPLSSQNFPPSTVNGSQG